MSHEPLPFEGFPLERMIGERAAGCGFALDSGAVLALALHARRVLASNQALHLTTIVEPGEFVERHVGEAFEGAALLPHGISGTLVDLGSGNGYPALPVASAHPALLVVLVEASTRKAAFLRELLAALPHGARAEVLERQVQRAADLGGAAEIRVLTCRAVGGWERLVPKLASALTADGTVLLWAGDAVETVRRRVAWKKLDLKERRQIPGRDRSAVWRFERST